MWNRFVRIALYIVLFNWSLLLSSCSYLVNFVVVNESDDLIEIEYTMKLDGFENQTEQLPPPDRMKPIKVTLEKWQNGISLEEWRRSAVSPYSFDQKSGKFIVRIKPKEVVRLLEGGDGYFFKDGYKDFPLIHIEMRGKNGKITIDGVELFRQFKRHSNSDLFLAYK